jgi:vancomycin resistance protein YoaR
MMMSGVIVTWLFVDNDRIISGVRVAQLDVSGLTEKEAHQRLQENLPSSEAFTITLKKDEQSWASSSAQLNWAPDYSHAIDQALQVGRTGNSLQQTGQRLLLLWKPVELSLKYQLDEQAVRNWLTLISQEIDKPGNPPHVEVTSSQFHVEPGVKGEIVDQEKMVEVIEQHPQNITLPLEMMSLHKPLTEAEVTRSEQRLQQLWGKTLSLSTSELEPTQELRPQDYFSWIQLPEGYDSAAIQQQLQTWNSQYARQPQDAKLEISADKKVTLFQAPVNGRSLEIEESQRRLQQALSQLENNPDKNAKAELAFSTVEPTVKLEDTNDLGLKERVGLGTSTFFHSIPNRVFNVNLTSERVNNTLVAPGEDFSFNAAVGEVTSRTGYKAAYVIRNGRTELGDGGGVCQVSTTVFRAALDAGFPISAWKAHSYRVGYYE